MPSTTNTTANDLIFLNLTCNRAIIEEYHQKEEEHQLSSTHDDAEMMLYAFVDSAPFVADLLWSKQQLKQGEFLTLTAEQEWSSGLDNSTTNDYTSTHEPRF